MDVVEKVLPPTPDPLKDPAPIPKKRGPYKKTALAAEKKEREDAEAIAKFREVQAKELAKLTGELIAWPFDVVAERRGEFWKLSKDETDRFSLALSRVGVKYLPMLERFKEELALVVTALTIFGSRIRRDRKEQAERERRPRDTGKEGIGKIAAVA